MSEEKKPVSKLQLRNKLVSIISKYRNVSLVKNEQIVQDIELLKSFGNDEYILKFLLKEMLSEKSANTNICALFVLELSTKDNLERISIELLSDKTIVDEKKFFLVSVLKQKGVDIDYDDIAGYIDNPDDVAKEGVRKFLNDILFDAEVQIDLLDFYTNIPEDEKIPLINNILEESEIDNCALVLTLISQLFTCTNEYTKEEFNLIFSRLLEAKSPYAIVGLENLLSNYKLDLKEQTKAKKVIKELKHNYPDFKPDNIIQNTKFYKSYISFVDGQSNFSLIFARVDDNNLFKTYLATINIEKGMISCMGFTHIARENFDAILQRLFTDSIPIEISPIALKGIINRYIKKNKETKTQIPYEYIVWQHLTDDISEINYDIDEFMASKLDTTNLDKAKVQKFVTSKLLATWYCTKHEEPLIDKLINDIESLHFKSFEELDKYITDYSNNFVLKDKNFIKMLNKRLLVLAYVCNLASLKMSSLCAYSLCFKNEFSDILVLSIVSKSVYYYFISKLLPENKKETVFRRKNDTKYTQDELNGFISEFEKKWNQRKEF